MGNNHLHSPLYSSYFHFKKHLRAGENFVIFQQVVKPPLQSILQYYWCIFQTCSNMVFLVLLSQNLWVFFNNQLLATVGHFFQFRCWDTIMKQHSYQKNSTAFEVYHPNSFSRFTVLLLFGKLWCFFWWYCFSLLLASKYLYAGLCSD